MSIQIENNLGAEDNHRLGKIHYIPCEVDGNGEANVEAYFDPYIKSEVDGSLTASFRGYPLRGETFPLPSGHSLTFVTEAKTPLGEEACRSFKVKGQARQEDITYWNWDIKPSQNDAICKAIKWISIAEVLHAPLILKENSTEN